MNKGTAAKIDSVRPRTMLKQQQTGREVKPPKQVHFIKK